MQEANMFDKEQNNELFSKLMTLLLKGMCFCFKFSVYLVISFIQMIINIISTLMDFENWDFLNKRRNFEDDKLLQVQVDESRNTSKHEYVVKRSKQYNKVHGEIENLLSLNRNQQAVLDSYMAEDVLAKIDIVVYESEKNALKQGYKFARETKYILEDGEIYESYIKSRVMRGE